MGHIKYSVYNVMFLLFLVSQTLTMTEVEPSPRFWHHTFSYKGNIFIRGGSTSNFSESEKNQLVTKVHQFNFIDKKWQQKKTKGVPHPGLTQTACVCVNGVLYTYGSGDRKVLSQLDIEELVWSQLWSTSESDDGSTPMIKASAGMAYFANGHLAVFGGYACPSGPLQPGSTFVPNPFEKDKGWTNEFHIFHIRKGKYFGLAHTSLYYYALQNAGSLQSSMEPDPLHVLISL